MFTNYSIKFLILVSFCLYCGVSSHLASPRNAKNAFKTSHNESIWERCVIPGVVAITFDDGPGGNQTLKVLDKLRELNVTSTFFVNGANNLDITNNPAIAIVQRTIQDGHTIGSHTWSHKNLTKGLTLDEIDFELEHLSDKLLKLFRKRPNLMRPPYGELNQTVIDVLGGDHGYEIIMWSIDTNDWAHPGNHEAGLNEYIVKLNGTDPATTLGFIALHHDPLPYSDEFAAIVINYVRKSGYRFVTLSECLGIRVKG